MERNGKNMKSIKTVLLVVTVLLASPNLLQAQTASVGSFNSIATPIQSIGDMPAQPDSVVQVAAESQGLELVSPTDLPPVGTFWIVTPGGTYPFPCPMPDTNAPTYQITDGVYLVDETGGQVLISHRRGASNATLATALAAQADAVVNLINQVQDDQFTRELASSLGLSMEMDSPSFSTMSPLYDPTGLYLEITNVSNGWSYVNLHNGTNFVYAIWSSTNLVAPFSNWEVETELFPTGDQTNVMPFSIQNLDRQVLFLRAEDWTGVDSDSDGIPDWWAWQYWGSINVTDTNLDYSGNNNTFAQDYSNNIVPTVFAYTGIGVANNYVNSMSAPVQLAVAGSPYYVAVSVDDTNYATDANWQAYAGTNVTVNLGMTAGWHDVWIGLRGHADDTNSAVWQWRRLKLDFTPPALVITSPTNGTVNVPVIQLTGFSSEALSSLAYDISNATGIATNQPVMITGQFYDTNTMEFTTNCFQGYDVPLTNGLNVLTLHATDLAGNLTTLTTNINYVPTTNLPAVNLVWPQDGMQISGSNLTIQGQVDDPTATATVTVVDANGNTNTFNGRIGREGNFWIENVPLNAGTNLLTVAAANAAGVSTTTLNLYQSSVNLTITAVTAGDTNVTGSMDTDGYTIWVNGNEATDNGDGTWTAQITPIGIGGGLVVAKAVPNGNSFNSSRRMAGRFQAMQDSDQGPDIYAEFTVQPPQGVFISQYFSHAETNSGIWWNFGVDDTEWLPESWHNNLDWRDGGGGHEEIYESEFYREWLIGADEIGWPVNSWPTALPDGSGFTVGGGGTTNLVTVGTPALAQEHSDINVNLDSVTTARQTRDTEKTLITGGSLGSTQKNLWVISATATDKATGLPVPYVQIKISTLGRLGTDSKLNLLLADNGTNKVTPTVNGTNYTFTVGTNEYPLAITANGTTLNNSTVVSNANFCVGQNVPFALTGLPTDGSVIATNFQWTLGGTLVNQTNPPVYSDGSPSYTNDPALLKNAVITNCWWISGGFSPPATYRASVTCDLIFTNGNPKQSFGAQGLFTMHRPKYETNFVNSITNALTHHHATNQPPGLDILQVYNSTFSLRIDSQFHGDAFAYITQTWTGSKGNADTNHCFNTQGNYYLDNSEVAGDVNEPPLTNNYILVVPDASDNILQFNDGPRISCDGFTWNDSGFKAYVRFEPIGGIPVTIGVVNWHCDGNTAPSPINPPYLTPQDYTPFPTSSSPQNLDGSYRVSTGDAKYDGFTTDNTFPSWIHTYYNTNHN